MRIIAATSRNLEKMVADGQFRADLYYRLNVITLNTPPLRGRLEDLPLLAEYLVDHICRQQGIPAVSYTHLDVYKRQVYVCPAIRWRLSYCAALPLAVVVLANMVASPPPRPIVSAESCLLYTSRCV